MPPVVSPPTMHLIISPIFNEPNTDLLPWENRSKWLTEGEYVLGLPPIEDNKNIKMQNTSNWHGEGEMRGECGDLGWFRLCVRTGNLKYKKCLNTPLFSTLSLKQATMHEEAEFVLKVLGVNIHAVVKN